jgi:hypothetical protein
MKKQIAILAASIAATLGGGSALANDPSGPFGVSLNIAGSSAFQSAFENELKSGTSSICVAGTYNKYQSNTNDFKAYTCTLKPGAASTGGGENAAIYYRGEGGSVMGLKPVPLIASSRSNSFRKVAVRRPFTSLGASPLSGVAKKEIPLA